ncbi:hypothetical protein FCV25MIE_10562, partial [Fagus crenata]
MSQHLIDHVPCNKEYGYNDLFRFITDNGAVLEKDYAPYKGEKGPPQAGSSKLYIDAFYKVSLNEKFIIKTLFRHLFSANITVDEAFDTYHK